MTVDTRQLRNLLAIADCGSFTGAADRLGISQPALSNSIALLERSLGVPVLVRSRRGSTVNEYGQILVRRASGLNALLSSAEAEVKLKAQGMEGPLSIGATPSVLARFLPDAICRLVKASGPVDISIVDGVDSTLLPALRSGKLDIIVGPVGDVFGVSEDIAEEPLLDDPFSIAAAAANPLTRQRSLALPELIDQPWVLPQEGSSYRLRVEAFFRAANVAWPRDCILTNSLPLQEAIVRGSDRIAIISLLQAMAQPDGGLKSIAIEGGGSRTIGMKTRRLGKPSPLAQRLADSLREAAAEVGTTP